MLIKLPLFRGGGNESCITYNNITNCLLEVPQRIKYTLENGILTIKAGSKIIKPIGFETDEITKKFDFITTGSDKSITTFLSSGKTLLYITNNNGLDYMRLGANFDGDTAPDISGLTYAKWYDSNQNIVKATTDGGTSWVGGYSLPFMLIDVAQDGIVNSVLQEFDVFGFIGSGTIWVNKGVKGLIPNYRNEDKTLKNIEITVNKLSITTTPMSNNASFNGIRLNSNGTINFITYLGEFEKAPAPSGYWGTYYNSTENVMYYNSQGTWIPIQSLVCTKDSSNGATPIASLQAKQPFKAVDDNVLAARAIGAVVPSSEKIQVTVGASGAEYIAPVNGYFQAGGSNSSSNAWMSISNATKQLHNGVTAARWANYGLADNVICEKGDRVRFNYSDLTSKSAYFVPMKGELDVYSA